MTHARNTTRAKFCLQSGVKKIKIISYLISSSQALTGTWAKISPWHSKAMADHCEHLDDRPTTTLAITKQVWNICSHYSIAFRKRIHSWFRHYNWFAGPFIAARVKLPSRLKKKFLLRRSEMNSASCSLQPSLGVLLFLLRIALSIFTLFIISKQISTLTCWDKGHWCAWQMVDFAECSSLNLGFLSTGF